MNTQSYVLLDRDGVINHDDVGYIKSVNEWIPISGSLEAITMFNENGFKVIVITNQSGIGRGLYDEPAMQEIHREMLKRVKQLGGKIENIYFCPHDPDAKCLCRKPEPGMFKAFSKDYDRQLNDLYYVGDKLSDLQAAKAAGAKSILVKTGKGEQTLAENPQINSPIFENLYEAAKFIIAEKKL